MKLKAEHVLEALKLNVIDVREARQLLLPDWPKNAAGLTWRNVETEKRDTADILQEMVKGGRFTATQKGLHLDGVQLPCREFDSVKDMIDSVSGKEMVLDAGGV